MLSALGPVGRPGRRWDGPTGLSQSKQTDDGIDRGCDQRGLKYAIGPNEKDPGKKRSEHGTGGVDRV